MNFNAKDPTSAFPSLLVSSKRSVVKRQKKKWRLGGYLRSILDGEPYIVDGGFINTLRLMRVGDFVVVVVVLQNGSNRTQDTFLPK